MGLIPLSPLGCHKINSSSLRRCNFTSFTSRGGYCFLLETQHPSASLAQLPSWGSSIPKYLLWDCLPKYLLQDCPIPGVQHKASPQAARAPYPMAGSTWNKINPTAIHLQFQTTQTAPICSADGGSCCPCLNAALVLTPLSPYCHNIQCLRIKGHFILKGSKTAR